MSAYASDVQLVQSEEEARRLNLDGKNVVIVDMPPSLKYLEWLLSGKKISRLYACFYQKESRIFSLSPTREHFKWYYAFLYKNGIYDIGRYGADLARLKGWPVQTINFMTKVFFELDFVKMDNGILSIVKQPKKRDLTESKTFRNIRK